MTHYFRYTITVIFKGWESQPKTTNFRMERKVISSQLGSKASNIIGGIG